MLQYDYSEFYVMWVFLNRKENSNSDFVLVLGMSINHIAYREGEKKPPKIW